MTVTLNDLQGDRIGQRFVAKIKRNAQHLIQAFDCFACQWSYVHVLYKITVYSLQFAKRLCSIAAPSRPDSSCRQLPNGQYFVSRSAAAKIADADAGNLHSTITLCRDSISRTWLDTFSRRNVVRCDDRICGEMLLEKCWRSRHFFGSSAMQCSQCSLVYRLCQSTVTRRWLLPSRICWKDWTRFWNSTFHLHPIEVFTPLADRHSSGNAPVTTTPHLWSDTSSPAS